MLFYNIIIKKECKEKIACHFIFFAIFSLIKNYTCGILLVKRGVSYQVVYNKITREAGRLSHCQ
jgi:hypothetical protein